MTDAVGELPEAEFAELLVWAYQGEVSGEALFVTLADAWSDNADSLRVLAELERDMARALVPRLAHYELEAGDDEQTRKTGRETATALTGYAWTDFLTLFEPVTDAALERYHRLRSITPEPDPVFDVLIAHEEALQAFSVAEISGNRERALDAVHEVIARLATTG